MGLLANGLDELRKKLGDMPATEFTLSQLGVAQALLYKQREVLPEELSMLRQLVKIYNDRRDKFTREALDG